MGAELYLEHKYGDKVKKYVRVRSNHPTFLIGSSQEADLRIQGKEVSGCHVALRFRDPHWFVCHVGPNSTTQIGNRPIVEERIEKSTVIEIGQHRLRLSPSGTGPDLFAHAGSSGDLKLHQVVVRKKGRVIDSLVLKAGQPYKFFDGETKHALPAPTSGEWIKTEVGARVVQQRLVASQEMVAAERLQIDQGLKKPMTIVTAIVVLLCLLIAVLPGSDKNPEIALDKKSLDIIYNAKMIKQKRTEAKSMAQSKAVKHGGTSDSAAPQQTTRAAPDEAQAPTVTAKTSQALTNLRQSGLSALIGKIAKRANKQGIMVASAGVSPDTLGSGRAFFSQGTSTVGGGGGASKVGSFRLGGVGTQGKAGGAANFKNGTALAGGSVGQGDVKISDDESVVEGGLDRDVIADVIKRNLGQIRYCYERQLSSNRELYGKVMVRFLIGAAGEVGEPKIDSSTMKSAMVEGCILRRVASWKFPQPKGGTTVKVSYPFLFKALD